MLTTFGDRALTGLLRTGTLEAKVEMSRHARELATGTSAAPGRHLKGDLSAISAIDARLAALAGHTQVTRAAALQFEAMQAAFDRLATSGDALGGQLRIALQSNITGALQAGAGQARVSFDEAVATLNLQVAGRSIFAGTAPEGPALAPAPEIMDALQAATAGATDVPALVQAVRDWFADPAGFAQAAWRGGPAQTAPLRLSPEVAAPPPETALAPEITAQLAALALGALVGTAPQAASPEGRAALAAASADALVSAQGGLIALQARTGLAEARVARAEAANGAEAAALGLARAEVLGVDPFEAATRLQEAQGRIEALYTLTARLSRLSLLEYLR
jgi:flagellar hook-associated protein 3 FlgL